MYSNGEIEISYADLFLWLIKKWYIFLIVLIIGGVLGGGFAFFKNTSMDNVSSEEKIAEAKDALTPREIKEVEDIVDSLNLAIVRKAELSAEMTTSSYSGDALEDAIKRVDYWNDVYNQQRSLGNNLANAQKDYYLLLTADPDKEPDHESILKYTLVGAAALLFLTAFCFCAVYAFTPTVKVSEDLSIMFKYPVLINLTGKPDEASMFSTDVSILIADSSLGELALIYNESDKTEKATVEKLLAAVENTKPGLSVIALDPLTSPEELKRLSHCDSVISLVSLKKTRFPRLREVLSYSERYGCKILGFVSINSRS